MRRVLVPVFSAAVLCVVAVPLAIAWAPAGRPQGRSPIIPIRLFPKKIRPPRKTLPKRQKRPEAFSCVYEAGGVRLCFDFDLNEIR